jgi:hypothetical protein
MAREGCHFFIWFVSHQLKLLRFPGPILIAARDSELTPPPSDVLY